MEFPKQIRSFLQGSGCIIDSPLKINMSGRSMLFHIITVRHAFDAKHSVLNVDINKNVILTLSPSFNFTKQ